jgi:pectinesterase
MQIYGSTTDTTSYTSNSVTITFGDSASQAGSDDPSGTLRVHKDNFALYNVNGALFFTRNSVSNSHL